MTDLADKASRERVQSDTSTTLFVEAGAGTGKTHALVRRLSTLLLDDEVPIDRIAAITFTEKAAAELRDRLRVHLVEQRDEGRVQADAALAGLDTAAIGTLHSFALRLLSENPLEAGIPPRVTVQQDTAESAALDALWQECAILLFGNGPTAPRDGDLARAVDDILDAGVSPNAFREIVEALHRDWDRLPGDPLHDGTPLPSTPDLTDVLATAGSIIDCRESCQDQADKLYAVLCDLEEWQENLQAALEDPTTSPTWAELLGTPTGPGNGGKGASWGGSEVVKEIKAEIKRLRDLCGSILTEHWRPRIQLVLDALTEVVRRHAAERQQRGTLQFHDQLVLARDLLHVPEVRDRVRQQYQRILIDEFQDTDPIQLDLAELLTSAVDGSGTEPGRLFTVGDPKQSIYRFRRADISTYLRARGDESDPSVSVERLSTNFRCSRAVVDWVNTVFDEILVPIEGVQPEYRPLEPAPGRPPHDPAHGPKPFVFRTDEVPPQCPPDATESTRRHWAEAADVSRVIATAVSEGWTHESKTGEHTPLRLGDIAILLPTRTSLPMIEECLDHAGIDFRTEASSIVYGTPEIRDLLLAVRTVANTADEASLVGALRSPLFGCGDDDLLRWRAGGGTWSFAARIPDELTDSPVADAMRYLSGLSRDSRRPGELLERLVNDRMVFETVAESPRRRDLWRRIRFVIEHAWHWEESAADPARADLRAYADWALSLTAEDARVPEAAIPEIGVDAVRITTIHASKGLEYPMVIVAGMSRTLRNSSPRLLWTEGDKAAPVTRFSTSVVDPAFADAAEQEKQHSRAERIRLLYVATTRAESRLAVSGYGYVLSKASKPKPLTSLWGSLLGSVIEEPDAPALVEFGEHLLEGAPAPTVDVPDRFEWAERSRAVSALSAERAGWSATGIVHPADTASTGVPETDDGSSPVDDTLVGPTLPEQLAISLRKRFSPDSARVEELPPKPTRAPVAAGPDVGTAVHHLAEHTDLGSLHSPGNGAVDGVDGRVLDAEALAGWRTWATDQLIALGLSGMLRSARDPEALAEMVAVAEAALTSDPVRRVASTRHWAELPVAGTLNTADGEPVAVDGIVDLVGEESDGSLSLVDYKTDVSVTTATVDEYLLQLCAYAALLTQSTGKPVTTIELVFCRGPRATVITRRLS